MRLKDLEVLAFDCQATSSNPNTGEEPVLHCKFQELPSRQMINVQVSAKNLSPNELRDRIEKTLKNCDPDGIVRIHIQGSVNEGALSVLTAPSLRSLAPQEMNVSLRFEDRSFFNFSKSKHDHHKSIQ